MSERAELRFQEFEVMGRVLEGPTALGAAEVVDLNTFERIIDVTEVTQAEARTDPLAKRIFDVAVASLGLLLSLPLWLMLAVAIKLDDGGPVFYRQLRWGKDGEPFRLYKFRTMKVGADEVRPATADDDRVTGPGRVMRRTGLDELPQLINILKGDMSLVGPRALAVGETLVDVSGAIRTYEEVPGFNERLFVRPGLTGMAAIYIPKDATPSRKLFYDLRYIRERSLLLDIKLVLLSVWISLRGRWESHEPKF